MTTERADDLITLMEGEFQQIIGRVIIQDQKTSGTAGGTFTSGAWQTRDLNTTILNTLGGGYNLAANQFTLAAGVYLINVKAPAFGVNRHQARLRNITDGITELSGSSEFSRDVADAQTSSCIISSFAIAASKTFEVQHRCTTTENANGFGVEAGSSFTVDKEVYTIAQLWKIG